MVNEQTQKMARMHRHAKRSPRPEPVLNNLKPRFSPTAIFDTDPPAAVTSTSASPTLVTTTSTTSVSPAPVTTTSTSAVPAKVPTTTSTQATQQQTTTSSTLSTSTTLTSSSTTTSSSSVTTTSTKPVAAVTTPAKSTDLSTTFVTTTFRSVAPVDSATASLSSASASATAAPSGGVSTAGIIGIAAAAVVGVSVLAGVGMYLLRRYSRRKDDEFNPDDFRRQSVVLADESPSPLYRGNSGGRGPRPPTMIERHYLNLSAPQPPASAYQPPQQYGAQNAYSDYSASPVTMGSFMPGEIVSPVSPGPGSPPPQGYQYANVPPSFFSPMGQSPIASPASVAPYGSAYDQQGRLMRTPSSGAVALTRGNSVAQSPPQHPGLNAPPMPENDYMDVTRASVTPYQAEQYAAISRQLNIAPVPLPQLSEEHEAGEDVHMPVPATDGNQSMVSPFTDPQENVSHYQSSRPSSEFHEHNSYGRTDEPVPRVPSIAPVLPDIQVQQRAFSPLSFPASPSPMRATFGVDANTAPAVRPDLPPLSPVASSPRRAQFVQNETRAHDGRETPVEIGFVESPASTPAPQATHHQTVVPATTSTDKKRPDTLYDDDDAYGGF